MSVRIHLRDQPHRAIALVSSSYVLIFRHSPTTTEAIPNASVQSFHSQSSNQTNASPRCIVEFSRLESIDLSDYRPLSTLPAKGTLGLITVNNDVFLCVVSAATKVATVRPGETVQKIDSVEFYCINSSDYDHVLNEEINPYPTNNLSEDGFDYEPNQARREGVLEHPCLALKKLLSGGTFYYSTDFDLTNRLQDRPIDASSFDLNSFDEGFLWNSYMIQPLIKFRSHLAPHEREALDASQILTSAIRGFVATMPIAAPISPLRGTAISGLPSTLTVISRLSCRRAGTRFNARGIDDDGNVANFVETETIFWTPSGLCFSFAQVRGSVPIFWEQATGLLPGQQKIQITRSAEATQPAFDKHFESLEVDFGSVHILNLLSREKASEIEISDRYRYHVRHSMLNNSVEKGASENFQLLKLTEFDFHAETRGPTGYEAASAIKQIIRESAESFAFYLAEEIDHPSEESSARVAGRDRPISRKATVILQQEGVFRTNCLDCLDRTNLIQTIVSQMALEAFLNQRNERARQDFWLRHSSLWADNGDALSRIYAGTGALKSSFTRSGKMSFAGALADARKSATRIYINNFTDKTRQYTMDLLLGRLMGQTPVRLYDPINDYVNSELTKRASEYSSSKPINIWVGTFNVNGQSEGTSEDLSAWLYPTSEVSKQQPEIYVVGFQEIVELSPQQIMSTDPGRRLLWEQAVQDTLNKGSEMDKYVLLRSGQLVGAALSIFVKSSILGDIKNVEGDVKKTGMSGMAGNKGAVAIRLDFANTRLCFVTAHLAAGFANYEERNRDYRTISHSIRFQRNRSIDDHDTIIWLGDFNYRIGLSDEKARRLIQAGDLNTLYDNDQLNIQMVKGNAFRFYSEKRPGFMPTYKYDRGTDTYDTSEKARIPAWCDRVLWRGDNLRQTSYNAAPIRCSDHRPVYATFQCTVNVVDEATKEDLSRRIYEKRRADVAGLTANTDLDDTDDEDLIGYDPISSGLPPASSDTRKWWLDNGQPVRSRVQPPDSGFVPNPARPSNPFVASDAPLWVSGQSKPPLPVRRGSQYSNTSQSTGLSVSDKSGPTPPRQTTATPRDLALPVRPVSKASTISETHPSSQRKVPPIPHKPARLASRHNSISGASFSSLSNDGSFTTGSGLPGPVSSNRSAKVITNPATSNSSASLLDDDIPPLLPPRQSTMGLMDDHDDNIDSLSSWKPLQPH